MANQVAKLLLRMPLDLKKNLRIVAAISCCSVNEQIVSYIRKGVEETRNEILSNPKIMLGKSD